MNQNITGTITAIQRYCLDDGPGIRTTVFLKGCPLRCAWCHNPETWKTSPECMQRADRCINCGACVSACPSDARRLQNGTLVFDRTRCIACGACAKSCPTEAVELCGKTMTVETVLKEVVRDRLFFNTSGGGMTVSSGECTLQPAFTLSLLHGAKALSLSTAIETCGFGDPAFFKEAAAPGTLFLFDLKCMDPIRHRALTGVSNEQILQNLEILMVMQAELILRLPLIPGVNDTDEDLSALCRYLKAHEGKYRAVEIMPYHALGTGKAAALDLTPFSVDSTLAADRCAKSQPRWKRFFEEYAIPVEI